MTAAIIQARMSSTRLPGKVLADLQGRAMLAYMVDRVRRATGLDTVAVATSVDPTDDAIGDLCAAEGITCIRGSLEDVLERYNHAAALLSADVVVRLTGDCPLVDPAVIDRVLAKFQEGGYDYVANTVPPPATFPNGMDVEVFSRAALERAARDARKPSEREHVTFHFWQNPGRFATCRVDLPVDLSAYRLTVDYEQDLRVVRTIVAALAPVERYFTMEAAIAYLDSNPSLRAANSGVDFGAGWAASFEKDRAVEN